jgi:hypothetical protein
VIRIEWFDMALRCELDEQLIKSCRKDLLTFRTPYKDFKHDILDFDFSLDWLSFNLWSLLGLNLVYVYDVD